YRPCEIAPFECKPHKGGRRRDQDDIANIGFGKGGPVKAFWHAGGGIPDQERVMMDKAGEQKSARSEKCCSHWRPPHPLSPEVALYLRLSDQAITSSLW